MAAADFKKTLDAYRAKAGEFRILDLPPTRYLMVDGHGDPNTGADWPGAIEALYPVAYKLKFASKRELGADYVVPPLEALWWADDMDAFTRTRDKSQWDWTAMIMAPEWIPLELVATHLTDGLRLDTLVEGRAVQTLHVGSYDDEGSVLERMHREFLPQSGLTMAGKHHEIYLSDARRVAPEKLRTILRQPVA